MTEKIGEDEEMNAALAEYKRKTNNRALDNAFMLCRRHGGGARTSVLGYSDAENTARRVLGIH